MPGKPAKNEPPDGSQRLDKWLWFARVVKSRTLAATLITQGRIRVNSEKVDKPSHTVKPGDVITSSIKRDVQVLRVVAPGDRRGPATEAQGLYEDLSPTPTPREASDAAPGAREDGSGRPTKRDRRLLDKLRERN